MKSIFLCGFMGCGKSHVGRCAAKLMGLHFIDLDNHIVSQESMSIPEIFASKGQMHFRELESLYIAKLAGSSAIIATGGGAMVNPENAALARKNGLVVYLDVDFETCYERIKEDKNRPLVQSNTKEQLRRLYNERRPHYLSNSDYVIAANDDPLIIAHKLKDCISKI